jgi:hypothetical protein
MVCIDAIALWANTVRRGGHLPYCLTRQRSRQGGIEGTGIEGPNGNGPNEIGCSLLLIGCSKSFNRFTQSFVPGAADLSATCHGPNALAVVLEVGSLPHPVSIKVNDETMPSGLGISGSAV